jgi:hypothetical protein
MGHTSEQRSGHALCGAKKKNGDPCRKFAGEGTTHPGIGRCKYHLGSVINHRKHAAKIEAKRLATQYVIDFGDTIDIEPADALLTVLQMSYGHLMYLKMQLAASIKNPSFKRDVLLQAWDLERDRVARIAKACLEVGIAERRIVLAERYGEVLAELLKGIFWDPELALNNKQMRILPDLLKRHLLPLEPAADSDHLLPPAASPANGA